VKTEDPFDQACDSLKALGKKYHKGSIVTDGQDDLGALLGFALDSETLQPQALIESPALHLRAYPATDIVCADDRRVASVNYYSNLASYMYQHRKGGIYTHAGFFKRQEEVLVLYISHKDGIAWLRPRAMFEDGRFTLLNSPADIQLEILK
jgi:hypothetical protein